MELNLWKVRAEARVRIRGYSDSMNPTYQQRLEELGFRMDELLTCIRRLPFSGPLVVQVNGGVFSIPQDLAVHMLVEEV